MDKEQKIRLLLYAVEDCKASSEELYVLMIALAYRGEEALNQVTQRKEQKKKKSTNNGMVFWTKAEDKILLDGNRSIESRVAELMRGGRTRKAVMVRLYSKTRPIAPKRRRKKSSYARWSADDDEFILSDLTLKEKIRKMKKDGRTARAVKARIAYLGRKGDKDVPK